MIQLLINCSSCDLYWIISEKFQEVYVPAHNISIDEFLLMWKGRLGFKQYIPLKRARFGVKSFMLCEDSSYTFSFKIYTGKENVAPRAQELSLSERVVVDLMQPLLQKAYHLYTDNWCTSLPLYRYLCRQGTLACGTVQSNRKGFPEQVKSAQLRRDELIACRSDELLAIKFKVKKVVFMLNTIHDDSVVHRPDRRHQISARQSQPVLLTTTNTWVALTALISCWNPMRCLTKHWNGTRRWPSTLCSFPCSTASLFIRRMVMENHSWDFNMKWWQPFSLKMEMVLTWRFPERRTSYNLLSVTLFRQFQQQPLNKSLRRAAKCAIRKECTKTVTTIVKAVWATQDFAIFPVLNFIILNSITGCESQLDQKALLRSKSIVHSK